MERKREKADKFQTIIWFILGFILVVVGGVILIPLLKIYGILWTLLAIGVTVYQGIKLFGKKNFTMWEILPEKDQ